MLLHFNRGWYRGSPERGGAHHAEGCPAVAQQRPDPRRAAYEIWRNGASCSRRKGIRRGFKVSSSPQTVEQLEHALVHKVSPVCYFIWTLFIVKTVVMPSLIGNTRHISVSASCHLALFWHRHCRLLIQLHCSRIETATACPSGLGSQPAHSAAIDSSKISDV